MSNGSEHLPEHATADAGSALDVAGISAIVRDYLTTETDVTRPSFHATAITSKIAAHVEALREADRAAALADMTDDASARVRHPTPHDMPLMLLLMEWRYMCSPMNRSTASALSRWVVELGYERAAEDPAASEQRAAEVLLVSTLRQWMDGFGAIGPDDDDLLVSIADVKAEVIGSLSLLVDRAATGRREVRLSEAEQGGVWEAALDSPSALYAAVERVLADRAAAEDHGLRARVEALAEFWVRDEDEGIEHVVGCQDYRCRECVVIACATDLRAAIGDDGRGGDRGAE